MAQLTLPSPTHLYGRVDKTKTLVYWYINVRTFFPATSKNWALGGTASQSSTLTHFATAAKAIYDNTDGNLDVVKSCSTAL